MQEIHEIKGAGPAAPLFTSTDAAGETDHLGRRSSTTEEWRKIDAVWGRSIPSQWRSQVYAKGIKRHFVGKGALSA